MRTAKDILTVVLLMVIVFMVCVQDGDIIHLKHRATMTEGGLVALGGGLVSLKGGLDSLNGGLDSHYLQAASAILWVSQQPQEKGPIIFVSPPGRGTGVFVSDNILLTAKHVVENRTELSGVVVVGSDGVTYTPIEILEDTDDDLAVVIIEGRTGPHLELGPRPSLSDIVTCIGSPLRQNPQLIMSWGRVSSEKWHELFLYDAFSSPGCSGGPIIVDGKVVGIAYARLTGSCSLSYATPVERLDPELLARLL